ncbi:hypothetical protein [Undibacterium oligocarboniphilum]|uniref:DUF2486 family protein n=1 Tax=Undibacterium oligocarboniphilum TaxID=666702 RepID=A0A850QNV3_9BURK|nr:hypothetical protein [Undibacterium oligocarboniphilum]MBC3871578.1 hypothetical protein [Undibacterium oligocarboniphilum]NVO79063.1 hypothetical protein [Undibacterium oligocarboniphilum]
MSTAHEDNIPLLTEIIFPETPTSAPAEKAVTTTQMQSQSISSVLTQDDWQQLEQRIREETLKQVLGRIDFVLEHRVRDNLADVLQTAVEGLTTEIRAGLKKSLEEMITRAVTQEITKIKMQK